MVMPAVVMDATAMTVVLSMVSPLNLAIRLQVLVVACAEEQPQALG